MDAIAVPSPSLRELQMRWEYISGMGGLSMDLWQQLRHPRCDQNALRTAHLCSDEFRLCLLLMVILIIAKLGYANYSQLETWNSLGPSYTRLLATKSLDHVTISRHPRKPGCSPSALYPEPI